MTYRSTYNITVSVFIFTYFSLFCLLFSVFENIEKPRV